eukprot:7635952-Pyramimonas_sp.AAC.1
MRRNLVGAVSVVQSRWGNPCRAWAMHPRLLCSAGEPIEAPRLYPCAKFEGKRSKEAGGSGKATTATCVEGARRG